MEFRFHSVNPSGECSVSLVAEMLLNSVLHAVQKIHLSRTSNKHAQNCAVMSTVQSVNFFLEWNAWTRDGPIPVSVSEISAYTHFFQYRQYRYRQAKKCADTADTVVSAISQVSAIFTNDIGNTIHWYRYRQYRRYRQRPVSAYRRIGKNVVSAHP